MCEKDYYYHLVPIKSCELNPSFKKDYYEVPGRCEKTYDEKGNLVSIKFDIQIVYSIGPQPKYIITYDDSIEIECEDCGHKFPLKEIKHSEYFGDEFAMSDTICPKCYAYDCCDLIYEEKPDDEGLFFSKGSDLLP